MADETTLTATSALIDGDNAANSVANETAKNEGKNSETRANASDGSGQAAGQSEQFSMPGKDATPEQWGEFYNKLGRPEAADGYELPVPKGDDGAFAKEASAWMHEAGLSKDQAGKLAGKWNEMVAKQQADQTAAAEAQAKATHEKNTAEATALKSEWGQQYDANMHHAKQFVTQFFPKDQAADLIGAIESKIGYAGAVKLLSGLGQKLGEHDAAGMGQNNAGTRRSTADVLYDKS